MPSTAFSLTALVVDSDDFQRKEVVGFLSRWLNRVYEAKNGDDAWRIYSSKMPDILVTDIVLPKLDGQELIDKVRELDEEAPVFVLYDGYNPSILLKILDRNISAFLFKPVDEDTLRKHLKRVVRTLFMKRQLLEARYSLEFVLNTYPSLAAMTEDGQVTYVNRRLLEYLGWTNYQGFVDSGKLLDPFLTEINGEKYEGRNGEWISVLLNDPLDRDHLVRLVNPRHPEKKPQPYLVAFNQFPIPGRHLFTFSDVGELDQERASLQTQATTDPLTGAGNRRSFLDRLAREQRRAMDGGEPFCLIMFDIDHFKSVNDTYGHDVGDSVLKEMTALVVGNIRDGDYLGRWGGEEFMLLEPYAGLESARAVAERLRRQVASFEFSGMDRPITSSFGVVQNKPGEDMEALTKRVDEALYQAKEGGRNRVVVG